MKYNWTEADLKQKLKELKFLYKHTQNEKEKEEIKNSYEYLQGELDEKNTYYLPLLTRELDFLTSFFDTHTYLKNDIITLATIHQKENDYQKMNMLKLQKNNLSVDNITSLVNNFYKDNFSNEFYQQFKTLYNHRYTHLRISKPTRDADSYIIQIPYLNEYYININNSYTIDTSLALTHEYAHAIHSIYNPNNIYDDFDSMTREIVPFTLELLASEYFKKANIFDAYKLKSNIDLTSWVNAYDTKELIQIIDVYQKYHFTKAHELKHICESELGFSYKHVKNLIRNNLSAMVPYVIDFIFAKELYYKFLDNPHLGEEYIKAYFKYQSNNYLDYYNFLKNDLGLRPHEHFDKFQEVLDNEIMILRRK